MRDEYIVGLDIGTTKICIAVGKKDDHGNKVEPIEEITMDLD